MSPRSKYRMMMTANLAGILAFAFLAYWLDIQWPFLAMVFWYLTVGVLAGHVECRVCGRKMGRIVNGWIWRMVSPPFSCDRCGFSLVEENLQNILAARQIWQDRP